MRFLAPRPRLSSSELGYLTAVDHIRHEALIAVDPETGQSFGRPAISATATIPRPRSSRLASAIRGCALAWNGAA